MKTIQKHSFEAVSLLTAENGTIELSIIPAIGQPDWVVPSSLILSVEPFEERIWTYLWDYAGHTQEVSVYHLTPKEIPSDKLIILEGNTDVHRLALQTTGDISTIRVRISDVKDITPDEEERAMIALSTPNLPNLESGQTDYLYQAVQIDGEMYFVPDLDLIAHHLVDLDG